jgi:hypothetical protein
MATVIRHLHDMVQNLYGVGTVHAVNNSVSGTAGAAVQVRPNNPRRLALTIVNLSANVIWVGPSNTVGIANGIWLAANGGSMSLTWDKDFELVCNDWWSLSAAGGDQLYVLEEMIQ